MDEKIYAKIRPGTFVVCSPNPDEDHPPGESYVCDQVYVERAHAGTQCLSVIEAAFPYAEIVVMPANVKLPGGRPE